MENMKPHAAVLISPGMGHLIPALELSNLMATHHAFHVTVFIASGGDHTSTSLIKSPNHQNLDLVFLPPVDASAIAGPDASLTVKLVVTMNESLNPLRRHISSMESPPMMLIVDMFGGEAFDIADEYNMLRYVFFTSNAWFLGYSVYPPFAVEEFIEEHYKGHKPLEIPGCRSARFEDTLEPMIVGEDIEPFLQGFIQLGIMISKADGILVNSWENLETTTIAAFRDQKLLGRFVDGAVYPVGPLVRNVGSSCSVHPVMDWLDRQPTESVLYVSFGSGGRLSVDQMTELACGLELSGQRFIWVVRPPSDNDASGSFFTVGEDSDNDLYYLPNEFLTRTSDVGLVVPSWAPQADILSHPSVGGFLSHCGWNSALESIMNGVPMITWPLYAEQRINAVLLTEEIGVAVRPKEWAGEDTVIEREEIQKMVRKVMVDEEGRGMREKARELKYSGEKASRKGGSSYQSMSQVAKECLHSLRAKSGGA